MNRLILSSIKSIALSKGVNIISLTSVISKRVVRYGKQCLTVNIVFFLHSPAADSNKNLSNDLSNCKYSYIVQNYW